MIKQVPIAKVVLLIDRTYSLLQLSNELSSFGKQAKVLFVEQQTGSGYFQWTLPGEGWKSFGDLDEETKRTVAVVYKQRIDMLRNALEGSPLCDAVLTVPSGNEFVFFRQNEGDWEIALTAWGYQFVNTPSAGEISAWVEQKEYQEVSIGFQWEGELQPNVSFLLQETQRVTSDDGFYHVDNPVEVGESFVLKVFDRFQFTVVVEKGKSEYIFDITQHLTVDVEVTKDGTPLAGQQCDISFNGTEYQLKTDESGRASVEMPLARNVDGSVLDPQPECVATCDLEVQQKTPAAFTGTLTFAFDFRLPEDEVEEDTDSVFSDGESEQESEPQSEPKYVKIRLLDYGGYPLPDLPFKLTTKKKGEQELKTDEKGYCQVPQEWFSPKEKMQIKFVVSPEYQETHDLHVKK